MSVIGMRFLPVGVVFSSGPCHIIGFRSDYSVIHDEVSEFGVRDLRGGGGALIIFSI